MTQPQLDRDGIEAVIPHREPFLFIDRIVEIEYGRRAVGYIDDIGALRRTCCGGTFPGFR